MYQSKLSITKDKSMPKKKENNLRRKKSIRQIENEREEVSPGSTTKKNASKIFFSLR